MNLTKAQRRSSLVPASSRREDGDHGGIGGRRRVSEPPRLLEK